MPISNILNITGEDRRVAGVRRPFFQSYVDALGALRRALYSGGRGVPAPALSAAEKYRRSVARCGAKRRRPVPSSYAGAVEMGARWRTEQMLSPALDAMMSQIQVLAQKIEAATLRVEEVSDKAEAAEQTALAMAELTALAATELAAFAKTDQAKIIGFRDGARRRNYGYSSNMDA